LFKKNDKKRKKKTRSPIIVHNDFDKERGKRKNASTLNPMDKSTIRPRNTRFCQRKINTVIYLFLWQIKEPSRRKTNRQMPRNTKKFVKKKKRAISPFETITPAQKINRRSK
jgi:short subunit dehydrogenase-like uncharacterized protein